ncbi:MAG: acyl-CoA/acyl-ACP dehydrogenase [Gammaproteobacteria bacterium]|nr:acyl-CoA/acyl-ACP dehydrogenase [Gammaproteobacteria bacterium]
MDFSFDEDQLAIRELAYQIFTDRATDEFLLNFSRTDATYDTELWSTLAEQGLLGISAPESVGGSGLGFTELCLILEEQGRRVAPVPLHATLVLGGLPIQQFGTAAQQQEWLAPLVAGQAKFTAAVAELGMNAALATEVTVSKSDDGWVLNGEKAVVPDAMAADFVLVPALDAAGRHSVFVVSTAAPGVSRKPEQIGLLGERAAHLSLTDVSLGEFALLGSVGQGEEIIDWLEQHANVAHCALQVGVAEEAMKRTAAYLGERQQFGVPLGTFQALAMRMADSYIDVEAMRSTYWLALWRLSEGLDARAEVRAAKWWACDAAHRVVCTSQHLHGGIGADVEYPIHRFFLWAKQIGYSLGNASTQLDKLGKLLAEDDSLGFRALEV